MGGETGAAGATTVGRSPGRAVRRRFLEVLGMTANVSRAAREAGVGTCSFYRLRMTDEAFRAAWEVALDEGCRQIELMLLAAALGEPLAEGVDRKQVLELLTRREARGRAAPTTMRGRQVTLASVERSLLRKLDTLDRRWRCRRGEGGKARVGGTTDGCGSDAGGGATDGGAAPGGMAECAGEAGPGGTPVPGRELAGLGA
jgi:hypothetical protein